MPRSVLPPGRENPIGIGGFHNKFDLRVEADDGGAEGGYELPGSPGMMAIRGAAGANADRSGKIPARAPRMNAYETLVENGALRDLSKSQWA